MYVLATLRYRVPIDVVERHTPDHRAYLRSLKERGTLVASGPFDPRTGGALLLRVPDGTGWDELAKLRDGDPFVTHGVAQYDLQAWNVTIGKDALDAVK
jgi:uncharacterized protein YciI